MADKEHKKPEAPKEPETADEIRDAEQARVQAAIDKAEAVREPFAEVIP